MNTKNTFIKSPIKIALAVIISMSVFASCTKKEENSNTSAPTKKASADAQLASLEKSAVSLVPSGASGFILVNTESSGFKKYLASNWAKSSSLVDIKKLQSESGAFAALSKSGFDLSDPNSFAKDIASIAFFVDTSGGSSTPVFGFVAQEKAGGSIEGKLSALRQALASESSIVIKDKTYGSAKGFQLILHTAADNSTANGIFFAWNGEIAVLSTSETSVSQIISSTKAGNLPDVVKTPGFKEAAEGTMDMGDVYASGYFEIEKLLAAIPDPKVIESLKNNPFKSLSFYGGMKDSPVTVSRITYDAAKMAAVQNGWTLKGSLTGVATSLLTHDPIFFLSLDGSVINALLNLAKSSDPTAKATLAPYEAILSNINRISLAATAPGIGKSALPVPELLLAFETSKPAELKQALTGLGTFASAMSGGMTSGKWNKKNIEGKEIEAMETPMGFGLYLTQLDNAVIATSTEQQITNSLRANKGSQPSLAKSLPASLGKPLGEEATIGLALISFPELTNFLRNIRDIAGMYVPNQNGAQFLTDEQLDKMKELGLSLMTFKSGHNLFELRASYEKTPNQAGASAS